MLSGMAGRAVELWKMVMKKKTENEVPGCPRQHSRI